jgi:hypothetical protein
LQKDPRQKSAPSVLISPNPIIGDNLRTAPVRGQRS